MDKAENSNDDSYASLVGLGGIFAFFQALSVIFAIAGYFAWPNVFSDHNAQMVLEGIDRSPGEYFMKLDPFVLFGTLLQFPVWLGLWAALQKTDKALAVLAVSLGIISTVSIISVRPMIELYHLSSLNAASQLANNKIVYAAAAEALLANFHGTSWAVSIMSGGLSSIVFAMLMRKNNSFKRITFWTMIISGFGGLFVLIPVIGIVFLFFLGTIIGILGTVFCGIDLLKYYHKNRQRMVVKN